MANPVLSIDAPVGTTLELRSTNEQNVYVVAIPGGAAAVDPLTSVFYIDNGKPAGGNGSIAAPFDSFAAASGVPDGSTLLVVPGDYSAEPDWSPTASRLTIEGIGSFTANLAELPEFAPLPANGRYTFRNAALAVRGTALQITFDECSVTSTATAGRHVVNGGVYTGSAGSLDATNDATLHGAINLAGTTGFPNRITSSNILASNGDPCTITAAGGLELRQLRCLVESFSSITIDVSGGTLVWDDISMRALALKPPATQSIVRAAAVESFDEPEAQYGLGTDGDVLVNATVAPGAVQYRNVTFTAAGVIETRIDQLRVVGILDLTAAVAGAIRARQNTSPGDGGGLNAAGAVGGAGGQGQDGRPHILQGGAVGANGANAGTGIGTAGPLPTAVPFSYGSNARASGAGGSANAGATAGGAATTSSLAERRKPWQFPIYPTSGATSTPPNAGGTFSAQSGSGGGSGAGDGVNAGGGGGGGGAAGEMMVIYARYVRLNAGLPNGVVINRSPNGGNGGNAAGGNAGGGGGGAAGGGASIVVVYDYLLGDKPVGTQAVIASAGNGGNGGNGSGTGLGGAGAGGGDSGQIFFFNRSRNQRTIVAGVNGTDGSPAVGTAGGAGGAGGSTAGAFVL